ncbi:hypothetical protein V6N11_054757 [Hibiscus sabdariffa]|uniref:Uncharacterized protein n=1 Tax=Hibiscus sabdariffa TaxID=183260 RepID=A0ABR2S519_9ROSI
MLLASDMNRIHSFLELNSLDIEQIYFSSSQTSLPSLDARIREYSDLIAIPAGIPSLPRLRISADILFSVDMSFLLVSRSFQSELLQYNFLHLDHAAFGFCQG